ncbi:MAG TPA: DUF4166 domain-containing protein [Burkholderiaceae bacterium]
MTRIVVSAASPAFIPSAPGLDLVAHVGAAGWARLPTAVRRRFGAGHGDVVYAGRITLRRSRAGRAFAALARLFGGPLTAAAGESLPAVVRVATDGRGGMTWERAFDAGGAHGMQVVRSTKETGPGGELVERTAGGLGMVLVAFEERGTLVFESRGFVFVLGRLRLRVPALLAPGTCRVVHADLGGGRFRFALDMRHPLWGHTFHQSGVFVDPHDATEEVAQ